MTKVISLSNTAYEELKLLKNTGESFSDVVLALIEKTKKYSLFDFFGSWPGEEKELVRIKKDLKEDRKKFKTRKVNF